MNLSDIFKDRLVLHSEDPTKIFQPRPLLEGQPIIIVEINDRTVNVYMLVTLQLRPADPSSLRRDQREHRSLAYSHTC